MHRIFVRIAYKSGTMNKPKTPLHKFGRDEKMRRKKKA